VHELAITQNILNTVLDEAKAAKAKSIIDINLVVGELSGVVTDSVEFYFDILKKDTIARDAKFNFTLTPARFRCRDCLNEFSTGDSYWTCPNCEGINIELVEGRDCYIESIEVE
jgi:hydrogenase nickel incorporation protein HypA/HybF